MANANDVQVGGTHYRAAYQHWDWVAENGLGYYDGAVTKYAFRAFKKNGVEDLQKALHYCTKLEELHKTHGYYRAFTPSHISREESLSRLKASNELGFNQTRVLELIAAMSTYGGDQTSVPATLVEVREHLLALTRLAVDRVKDHARLLVHGGPGAQAK
jgi:Protein of unknwon function (DUF3310)